MQQIAEDARNNSDEFLKLSPEDRARWLNSIVDPEPFRGDHAAMEGQNQATWGGNTCVEVQTDVFSEGDIDCEQVCAGDNLVTCETIQPPADCPSGAEDTQAQP